ncbi:MAG: hypothetical protein Ct9H90mP25_1140 [Gammaproteobacteria bacterium]|nr:MAG: hypothetical protein Ct9H90mP25_1140 [Gammaproteobacteria bacterium]
MNGGRFQSYFWSLESNPLGGDYQTVAGSAENVGIRVVGFTEESDSFRDTVEIEKYGFYPSLTVELSDETEVTYELELTKQEVPLLSRGRYSERYGFSPERLLVANLVMGQTIQRFLGISLSSNITLTIHGVF